MNTKQYCFSVVKHRDLDFSRIVEDNDEPITVVHGPIINNLTPTLVMLKSDFLDGFEAGDRIPLMSELLYKDWGYELVGLISNRDSRYVFVADYNSEYSRQQLNGARANAGLLNKASLLMLYKEVKKALEFERRIKITVTSYACGK